MVNNLEGNRIVRISTAFNLIDAIAVALRLLVRWKEYVVLTWNVMVPAPGPMSLE